MFDADIVTLCTPCNSQYAFWLTDGPALGLNEVMGKSASLTSSNLALLDLCILPLKYLYQRKNPLGITVANKAVG